MKIVYVAKHDSGGNDDEGAITHALTSLGHDVQRVQERNGHKAPKVPDGDLLLFHKWYDPETLTRYKGKIKRAFWYFDLVEFPDPSLQRRNESRVLWMELVVPHVDVGFCTDGDWVGKDRSGKLLWLPQGADERTLSAGPGVEEGRKLQLVFTGTANGGQLRSSFVQEVAGRYGGAFTHVLRGVHGPQMADLVTNSKILLAPDGPVTDSYWSNRVYNALGFGGFLLHPYCTELTDQYEDRKELCLYHGRADMHQMIAYYLNRPEERLRIATAGLARTKKEHLYRHRCIELIKEVREL